MLFAVAMNYLLADVALALVALVVGFLSGLFYCRYLSSQHAGAINDDAIDPERAANDAERTSMAVEQVRALTESVASDVSEHNELVGQFSEELEAADGNSEEAQAAISAAVKEMIAANERLTSRLEDAEQKIRTQAEEIRVQQSEARTDALTNLANRRAFDDAVAVSSDRFYGSGTPFSLVLLDVDHFKAFNDIHGHQAGDEVLRRVSRTLQEVVKKTDAPCRYGGEEFAVVMAGTNVAQGRVAAERIRNAIEAMVIDFEGERLRVTASVGVAEIQEGEQTGPFIRRVDDAVYAAKKAGRNNSHWNDGSNCLPIELDEPVAEEEESSRTRAMRMAGQPVGEASLTDAAAFRAALERRIADCRRFEVTLSVLHLRVVDYADLVHDYGDALGEMILDAVAGFIASTLREIDLLAKLDHGQFAVMLPDSNEKEAGLIGQRIQTAISNCVIPLGDAKLRLEVDLGLATVQADDVADTLLDRAAENLEPTRSMEVEA